MPHRCESIVLRRTRFSESSLVVVLFTREFGRVDALAKGCRRPASPMRGHLDLFSVEDALIYERARGGLDLVTETQVIEEYMVLRRSAVSLAAASVVGEMLLYGCMARDPHPGAFQALTQGLEAMDRGGDVISTTAWMMFASLRELGFAPRLDACGGCGAAIEERGEVRLSGTRGGVVCDACAPGRNGRSLSVRGLAALRFLSRAPAGVQVRMALPAADARDVLEGLGRYAEDTLGRGLQSKDVLLGPLRGAKRASPGAGSGGTVTRAAARNGGMHG